MRWLAVVIAIVPAVVLNIMGMVIAICYDAFMDGLRYKL